MEEASGLWKGSNSWRPCAALEAGSCLGGGKGNGSMGLAGLVGFLPFSMGPRPVNYPLKLVADCPCVWRALGHAPEGAPARLWLRGRSGASVLTHSWQLASFQVCGLRPKSWDQDTAEAGH